MTLTELQTQVLTDLNRTDQTANVSNAVTSAIKHYSMERWYFLEGRAYASLSSSQAFYAVPNDMMNPDNLLITISGSRTPIDRVDYSEMDEHDDGATFGQPTEWCYYQDNIRLYPVPDGGYTMTLSYHKVLADITGSASNAWTTIGKDLIRHAAVKEIRQSVLHDAEGAQLAASKELEAYVQLQRLNIRRTTQGRIKKVQW